MQELENKLKGLLTMPPFDSSQLEDFEKASKEFDEMVSKGLVKRRGYTLQTIDKVWYPSVTFNTARKPIG